MFRTIGDPVSLWESRLNLLLNVRQRGGSPVIVLNSFS